MDEFQRHLRQLEQITNPPHLRTLRQLENLKNHHHPAIASAHSWTQTSTTQSFLSNILKQILGTQRALETTWKLLQTIDVSEPTKTLTHFIKNLDRLQRWTLRLPEDLRIALADSNTFPHPELSLQDLKAVLDSYEEEGSEAAVRKLDHLHEELFLDSTFRKNMKERWQGHGRWAAVRDALGAHDAGFYAASVPTAIIQTEGLLADTIVAKNGPSRVKQLEIRKHAHDLISQQKIHAPPASAFLEGLFEPFFHGEGAVPPFSRHAILHGGDTQYGSKKNSTRALVWLDSVHTWLSEATPDEPANKPLSAPPDLGAAGELGSQRLANTPVKAEATHPAAVKAIAKTN